MSIKISIPYSIIPLPGSPDLILPLMPDHNLRLNHSTVFPLYRRSNQSKPTILASNPLPPEAHLAADVLNLSKSFRLQNTKRHKPPLVNVVVRNFTISLVVSPSYLPSLNPPIGIDPRSPMAEYAIVLDCLSHWSITPPNWPFSVILPTPPCLKNSFRMLLPTDSTEDLTSSSLHLTTFPPLRRERSRFSTLSNPFHGSTQSSVVFSDDDLRPLSDESEPEGISSLPDDDDEPNHDPCTYWPQDAHAPRVEGVFQSTKELCIVIGSGSQVESYALTHPIMAKRASTRLSMSVRRPPSQTSPSVSIDLNFHVELEQISTQSTNSKTPFVLSIPQQVADHIISARWSPLNTEGVVQTSFPPPLPGKQDTPSNSLLTTHQPTPSSSPSSLDLSFPPTTDPTLPELDLLHTAAPFPELDSDARADSIPKEADIDLKPDWTDGQEDKSESKVPYQFVAWFDTEWLIRSVATCHNPSNSRIVLNLNGQLDLALSPSLTANDAPGHDVFPIPFFVLPSADEHICACQISMIPTDSSSRQELHLDLPSWANSLETSTEQQLHQLQFHLDNSPHTQNDLIIANLHQLESVLSDSAGPMSPTRKAAQPTAAFQPSLPESNVSIGTLIISPAGRIRHHSRRSTLSNLCFARKRARHSVSMKNSKITNLVDEKQTDPPPKKITASIRSVQHDLLIASPYSSESPLTQYGELAITLCRPNEKIADPWVGLSFRIASDESVEILGAWIGDRELIQFEGFKYSEEFESDLETGEVSRLVVMKFDVPDICNSGKLESSQPLPILRISVKSQKPKVQLKTELLDPNEKIGEKKKEIKNFDCLLPSFDSSVGIYKVSLHTCTTFQLVINQSNMVTFEKSSNVTQLVQYSLPPGAISQTFASIKPVNCTSRVETLEVSSSKSCGNQSVDEIHARECDTSEGLQVGIDRPSWPEHYMVKLGLNFKTLLLCWLIYLVSFMSIQLDEMGSRLELIDQRVSQLPSSPESSCKVQPSTIYQTSEAVDKLKEICKEPSFSHTVKPFLSQMMSDTFKPSSVISYKDFLATDDQDVVVETKEEGKVDRSSEPSSMSQSNHSPPPPDPRTPPSTGEINKVYYWSFFFRLLPRSFIDPFSKLLDKLHFI